MNNKIKIGLAFVAGLAIGAFAMKKVNDRKEYIENMPEEYIEEMYEDEDNVEQETIEEVKTEPAVQGNGRIDYSKIKTTECEEYTRALEHLRYREAEEAEAKAILDEFYDAEEEDIDRTKPYRITQDEYEDRDAFESDEYTYYADGYLTDSYGFPIDEEDIVNSIGLSSLEYFKYCDEDQMWVRNERLKMDFSVIRDIDKFVDVAPPRIKKMVGLQ